MKVVGAHGAGRFGTAQSPDLLFPLAAVAGGVIPLLAAMWAYEARDTLATAMLGVWGAFWLGYGLLHAAVLTGRLAAPVGRSPELAFWFIALAATTWMGAWAALGTDHVALTATLALLAAGTTIEAIARGLDVHALTLLGGWVLLVGAVTAWYTATAMMLEDVSGREVLPAGHGVAGAYSSRPATPPAVRPAPPSQRSA